MTDGWTNAKGQTKKYPVDFPIENSVQVYTCQSTNKRVIISNGIPDHDVVIGRNNDGVCAFPYVLELPLNPVISGSLSELPIRGIIAMGKNGVPAFGPQESDSLNALGNETDKKDASFWYGHSSPQKDWHTHNPYMGEKVVDSTTFLGWSMDGFEIYGPVSDEEVKDLDECNGMVGVDGVYRYHIRTLDQVDGDAEYCVSGYNNNQNDVRINWNYILGCYSGDISDTKFMDSTNYQLDSDCVQEGFPTASPTPEPTKDPNAPSRPNIIVMQPDDLVFFDEWTPPPNNPKTPNKQETFPAAGLPNIDALRTGGLQMMQAYTASPKCGTSRYSTITGKMPGRSQSIRNLFDDQISDVTIPNTKLDGEDCLAENLAAALNSEGYTTAMFGKWHLTKINRNTYTYQEAVDSVQECGFDVVSGLYMENMEEANGFNNYITGSFSHNMEWITHEAISFINETTSQPDPEPFFMYFNPTVPHGSQNILDALQNHTCTDTPAGSDGEEFWIKGMAEDSGCAAYRQTIIDRADGDYKALGQIWLDDSVGALVQSLKDNGVYDNTIFVFQNDHGMLVKGALYEGGIRIPQFVHYPNEIAPNTKLDAPVSTVDVAATMLDYAGVDDPPYQMDGVSWRNVIGNAEKEAYWKNERCLFFEMEEDRATRCGCHKYLDIDNDSSDTYAEGVSKGFPVDLDGMLFDLCDTNDLYVTEKNNNMEVATVDDPTALIELTDALNCYQENSNPGSIPSYDTCGPAAPVEPTDAPVAPTVAPVTPTDAPTGAPNDAPVTEAPTNAVIPFVNTDENGNPICEDLPVNVRFNVIFGEDDRDTGDEDDPEDKKRKNCASMEGFNIRQSETWCNRDARIRGIPQEYEEVLPNGSYVKVYNLCPESCRACADTCADSNQVFTVEGADPPVNRRCTYLDKRTDATAARLCRNKIALMKRGRVAQKPMTEQCPRTCGLLGEGKCAAFLSNSIEV